MSRAYFSPAARQDLLDILEFISRDKPGAAIAYVEKLEADCRMLAKNPDLGALRDDLLPGIRIWSVGKYAVFFRSAHDCIEVVRVVHGSRDFGRIL
jgi:toxin ParE1/3/4